MTIYEEAKNILHELFAKDYQFSLATSYDDYPSVRVVDTFYDDEAFYIVSYAASQKVMEIEKNPQISMCNKLYRFRGSAYNIGHPLSEKNRAIREKLIKVFEPWYFLHNNENDEKICYIKIELKEGFFYKDGNGYKVDFKNKSADKFPFTFEISTID